MMRRLAICCAALCTLGATRAFAQQISLGTLSRLSIPTGVDTLDRCTQPRGGSPSACAKPYFRSIQRAADSGYELRNEYFDSTGKAEAVQTTRVAQTLAVRYQRVQATADSAALVITDGMASAWVVSRGGTRLLGMTAVSDRYAPELVELALGKASPSVGAFVVFSVGNLYGPNPLGVTVDTLRVAEHRYMTMNGSRTGVVRLVHTTGTMAWVETKTGRLIARRGAAGPSMFWWHVRRGVDVLSLVLDG